MSDIFKPKPSIIEKTELSLKRIENELFEECTKVVFSVVSDTFAIDPSNPEVPAEWLEEIQGCATEEDAARKMRELETRLRIAKASWLAPKEAPVALQIAAKVLSGMQKARANSQDGNRTLNVNVVSITAPTPVFPEKEIKVE